MPVHNIILYHERERMEKLRPRKNSDGFGFFCYFLTSCWLLLAAECSVLACSCPLSFPFIIDHLWHSGSVQFFCVPSALRSSVSSVQFNSWFMMASFSISLVILFRFLPVGDVIIRLQTTCELCQNDVERNTVARTWWSLRRSSSDADECSGTLEPSSWCMISFVCAKKWQSSYLQFPTVSNYMIVRDASRNGRGFSSWEENS